MKIFKSITFGIVGGLVYAIISFVLLSSHLRGNVGAVLYWGFQGLLFSVSYLILSFLFSKLNKIKEISKNTIIGGLSGIFSCSFNIIATLSSFYKGTERPNGYVPPEIVQNLIYQLTLYAIGSLLLGTIIGYLIGQKNTLISRRPNK